MSSQYLKGEQPLSQRSWLGITLISLDWVKQDSLMRVCWGKKLELATPSSEDRLHGVGLAIRTNVMKDTPSLPVGINEHLMKLHLPLNRTHHITISTAYTPTLNGPDEAKEQFGEDLGHLIKATPPSDKLIILGDFNTWVGKVSDDWKGVLGPHRVGNLNSNGLLLSRCADCMLCITNTIFHQADLYKTIWMHPRSKQWNLTDFVIIKQRDIHDVRITHVMHGAECWTDHRFVSSILKLHIAPTQYKHPEVMRSPHLTWPDSDTPITTTGFGKHLMRSSGQCTPHWRQLWEVVPV